MIYLSKDASVLFSQKFFCVNNHEKTYIIYKPDKSRLQTALNNKEDCNFYSLLDKDQKDKNIFLLCTKNKNTLMNKLFKILEEEKLNIIYVPVGSIWNVLFLTENDIKKEKYSNSKTEDTSWPCAIAKKESVVFLKSKLRPERELASIILTLPKID